ncbi:hypothetical protein ACWCSH_37035 [Streptosporangium sp. NPDC001682]
MRDVRPGDLLAVEMAEELTREEELAVVFGRPGKPGDDEIIETPVDDDVANLRQQVPVQEEKYDLLGRIERRRSKVQPRCPGVVLRQQGGQSLLIARGTEAEGGRTAHDETDRTRGQIFLQ